MDDFDLSVLTDNRNHTIKSLVPAIVDLFKGFEHQFSTMMDGIKKQLLDFTREYDQKFTELKNELSVVKKQVASLEDKIDENEAYERRDTLILSGKAVPPCSNNEDCMAVVSKVLTDHLHYVVTPSDISTLHRLGKRPASQGPDNRSIIIKFCRRSSKLDLLASARRVRPANLFLNESLTPQRQNIAYALRKAKREFPTIISGTSSIDGKVFVWLKPPNPEARGARDTKMAINNYAALKNFCERSLEKPVTYFLPN